MISEIKPIKARTTEERLARLDGILEQVTRNYATMAERFTMMAEAYAILLDEREKANAMQKEQEG